MTWFVNLISNTSQVTQVMVSLAIIISAGYLVSRLTKLAKLPNVTGYILAGILIGPYCLNLIPGQVIGGLDFISDIALAFIAFSVGEFFKFANFKKGGAKIIIITLFEALLASLVVFVIMYFMLHLNLAFAIVLSALASATAPASTVMIIRQTKSKGDFVDTTLQVIAMDNVISLIAFSIALSIALSSILGNGISFSVIAMPILKNFIALVIGVALGFILMWLIGHKKNSDNRLIIVVFVILLFCGICSLLDVSPLLGSMAIGTIYINFAKDEKLFLQVNYFSPPFLLIFFVKSGLGFNFSALFSQSNTLGMSLVAVSLIYFFARILSKYAGAFLGAKVSKASKSIQRYLGLALIPQAGVAIGLAALAGRTLPGEVGESLQTIILASSVLYELVGPICAKFSLFLSKSYSTKIEDVAQVPEITPDGQQKSEIQILIDRINAIEQQNIQQNLPSQEEQAFTEASEEELEMLYNDIQKRRNRNKRF